MFSVFFTHGTEISDIELLLHVAKNELFSYFCLQANDHHVEE